MYIRGELKIRLRLAPASCAFLSGVRAPYMRDNKIENWGMTNHFASTRSNQAYVEKTLAEMAAQQASFDLSLPYTFRTRSRTWQKVYFCVHSDGYLKLRKRLDHSLGDALVFNRPNEEDGVRSPNRGKLIRRIEALGNDPDPRPRILLVGKTDSETADRIVEKLNKAHPNGFPTLSVSGFDLSETPAQQHTTGSKIFTLLKTFPFLGEGSKDES